MGAPDVGVTPGAPYDPHWIGGHNVVKGNGNRSGVIGGADLFLACVACANSRVSEGDVAGMIFHCHWCRRQFQAKGWAGMARLLPHPDADRVGRVYVCEECEVARGLGYASMTELQETVVTRVPVRRVAS